jgi:serine/threonine protein kinase/tetratricopeptide (TPR) repeat protein
MHQANAKAEEIFHAALEFESPRDRSAFLDKVCGEPELRRRVEWLLGLVPEASGFLEAPASMPTGTAAHDSRLGIEQPGTVIGPYKLREQIGEGGMGVVYVAEQTQPVRRKVALKIIKPGMDTKQVIARFEAERQALAMMDHPNIAKVFDAGTTGIKDEGGRLKDEQEAAKRPDSSFIPHPSSFQPQGRPYFVMELVRGMPITDYCDRERLSIPERLELFVQVCRAVQHAHQKGIIHRDLKPSNILVTVIDGAAVPKIIDFGVAKAMGHQLTERTLYTAFHQFVGTPLYMSPEQADLSGMDVDTRSDIYSLGVLLYELLTGTTPFDQDTFRQAAFDEMRRLIREQEPQSPSVRLSSLGETLLTVSARRNADPRRLGPSLRGELDWIVMKALEKDRKRRYETANDFAADVVRFLSDQPVHACPPSAWYRFTKLLRRNRAGLTTAAVVAVALLAGTAVSLWQAIKARDAAREASQRAEESRQVVDYLAKDVFGVTVPSKRGRRSVTVGELLDHADATLGERFRGQPLVEASARMALAESYKWIYQDDRAERNVARAVQIREQYLGPEHPATLEALSLQVSLLCSAGWGGQPQPNQAAERIARRVLASGRRVLGPAHPDTLWAHTHLAHTLSNVGQHNEAEDVATQAEALSVRFLGPEHEVTLGVQYILGLIAERHGDLARAEALDRHILEIHERGHEAPDLLAAGYALERLAAVVRMQGRADEARQIYLETISRFAQVYGLSHKATRLVIGYLFSLLKEQRDYAAIRDLCEGWLRELLAIPPELDPYERTRRSVQLVYLVSTLASLPDGIPFDADLAIRAADHVSEEARRSAGDPGVLNNIVWSLARARGTRLQVGPQAVALARKAVELEPESSIFLNTLGVALYRAGDWKAAIEALEKAEALAPDKELAYDGLFLAMAHWQLGHADEARTWYDRSVAWMEQRDPKNEELVRFRAEAAALLGLADLPDDVFARP